MCWNTHEEYLVVFIAVQKLVGIGNSFEDMRVSMTCEIGFKMPIQTIFGQVSSVKKEANESLSQFHSLGTQ